MELITYTEPEAFLQVVQTQLERREAANSLMLGGVLNMRARSLKTSNSLVLISVQNDGAWSLAAVMTPPYPSWRARSLLFGPARPAAGLPA